MLISVLLLLPIAAGGLALTYLIEKDGPFLWRLAAGTVIGSALYGTLAFVIGCFAGLTVAAPVAMVLTLAIPIRAVYGLEDFITTRHLDNMAKVMLATGLIVAYGYLMEFFMAWRSGNKFEWYMTMNRLRGPYWPVYWSVMLCNVLLPQLLWSRRVRRSTLALFLLALVINTGMWLERYLIVVVSLSRDFMPSAWGMYRGTVWDYATFIGTLGFFVFMMLLFIRFLPAISIFEMRTLLPEAGVKEATKEGAGWKDGHPSTA